MQEFEKHKGVSEHIKRMTYTGNTGSSVEWDSFLLKLNEALSTSIGIEDAAAAGNSVLLNEQASLLRECRAAIDSLISQRKGIEALTCGSTTLGNLRAELFKYRPQGVFGCDT